MELRIINALSNEQLDSLTERDQTVLLALINAFVAECHLQYALATSQCNEKALRYGNCVLFLDGCRGHRGPG